MKKAISSIFMLTTFYLILNTFPIFAQSKILINEFLIDPQPQSVEIFNSGTESTDISDWIIDDSGGTTFYTIPKDSIIFPNQCLVFSADFNLNKTSADTVKLINNSQQLVDSFSYKSSSGSGISYFRTPDGSDSWTSGNSNLGKYYQTNNSCLISSSPTPTLMPELTTTPTEGTGNPSPICTDQACLIPMITSIPQSFENIYISEAMTNPPTGEKEWIEIYNNNDFSVSLNNWFIDDLEDAGSSPKIFFLEINAKSYAIFDLTSSIFNNDEDSVRLLDFNNILKDDFEYQETETGKTLGRTSFDSDDFCLQEPSKNSVNNPCINYSVLTGQTTLSPTISSLMNFDVPANNPTQSKAIGLIRGINYPTEVIKKNSNNNDVLGVSDELIIQPHNQKSFINLLTVLSASYSLLTICSILFRMKLTYGKHKNFYSASLRSS